MLTHLHQQSLTTAEHCYLWDAAHSFECNYECLADWAELHFERALDPEELMDLRFNMRDMILERAVKVGVARLDIL